MIYENGTACFNWKENYSCCPLDEDMFVDPRHPSMVLPRHPILEPIQYHRMPMNQYKIN